MMGPNGSGKSTLAQALMGRPGTEVTEGSIKMDGQELVGLPAWQRARAGLFLALQHPVEVPGVGLPSLLAAALGRGEESEGDLPARMVEEAKSVGLDPRLLRRPLNVDLSGGERKRTEMVQLGVLRPAISILDEVDSGLDVDALGEVARRLQQATTEWDVGILAITHFSRFLVQLEADLVHVIVGGRIVATGDAALALELEQTGYAGYQGDGA
jgi:Fe-S cluster assembly ATP-binding protein